MYPCSCVVLGVYSSGRRSSVSACVSVCVIGETATTSGESDDDNSEARDVRGTKLWCASSLWSLQVYVYPAQVDAAPIAQERTRRSRSRDVDPLLHLPSIFSSNPLPTPRVLNIASKYNFSPRCSPARDSLVEREGRRLPAAPAGHHHLFAQP